MGWFLHDFINFQLAMQNFPRLAILKDVRPIWSKSVRRAGAQMYPNAGFMQINSQTIEGKADKKET